MYRCPIVLTHCIVNNAVPLHLLILGILFFSSSASRAACLGPEVALFRKPFESRPTDPIRREVFRQQPANGSTWFTPGPAPRVRATPLPRATEASVGPIPKVKRRRRN